MQSFSLLRPPGVIVAAIVAGLLGLIGTGIGGFMVIAGALSSGPGSWGPLVAALGLMLVLPGLFELAVAAGVWQMKAWAWWLGVIGNGLVLAYGVYLVIGSGVLNLGSLVIVGLAVIVVCLLLPQVRRGFGIGVGR